MPQDRYGQNQEWNCPKCQTLNAGTSCTLCGYVRPNRGSRQPAIFCRSCGQQNQPQAKYCTCCGKPLAGPQEKKKTPYLIVLIVIAVLFAVILAAAFLLLGRQADNSPPAEEPAPSVTEPSTQAAEHTAATAAPETMPLKPAVEGSSAVVTEADVLRNSPSTGSRTVGQLNPGDKVEVTRIDSIGSARWAYVYADSLGQPGWIPADHLGR